MASLHADAHGGVALDQRHVQDRLALFVVLTPLAWIDLRLPRRAMTAMSLTFAVLALAYLGYIIERFRYTGAYVARLVHSAEGLGERATFMPLLYEIAPPDTLVPVYFHAVDYAAMKREILLPVRADLDDRSPACKRTLDRSSQVRGSRRPLVSASV